MPGLVEKETSALSRPPSASARVGRERECVLQGALSIAPIHVTCHKQTTTSYYRYHGCGAVLAPQTAQRITQTCNATSAMSRIRGTLSARCKWTVCVIQSYERARAVRVRALSRAGLDGCCDWATKATDVRGRNCQRRKHDCAVCSRPCAFFGSIVCSWYLMLCLGARQTCSAAASANACSV